MTYNEHDYIYTKKLVEEYKDRLAIMQAYLDGKEIEWCPHIDGDWVDVDLLWICGTKLWDWNRVYKFRVKLEEKEV